MNERSKSNSSGLGSTKTVDESSPSAEGVTVAVLTISIPGTDAMKVPITNLHRKIVLGRDPRADVLLDDQVVSRLHAMISRDRDRFFIEDLGSKNGTVLNRRFLRSGKPIRLAHGDEIQIGRITVTFESSMPTPKPSPKPTAPVSVGSTALPLISTGYSELDGHMGGGIPEGYAVLMLSPSYDERDLLLKGLVESAIASGRSTFYISSDLTKTTQLVEKYPRDFYALCPHAGSVTNRPNLLLIPGIENLSEVNISVSAATTNGRLSNARTRIMILDIVSDILLRYKSVVTRRWLSDFIAKRKVQMFTLLATLNPLMIADSEVQAITDLFDGILKIYEKNARGNPLRYLMIKKMVERRYSPRELQLNKDKMSRWG